MPPILGFGIGENDRGIRGFGIPRLQSLVHKGVCMIISWVGRRSATRPYWSTESATSSVWTARWSQTSVSCTTASASSARRTRPTSRSTTRRYRASTGCQPVARSAHLPSSLRPKALSTSSTRNSRSTAAIMVRSVQSDVTEREFIAHNVKINLYCASHTNKSWI